MNSGKPRVILRRCADYEPGRLTAILREMLHDLKVDVRGRVFVKPNIVTANRRYIRHSYTEPAVVESLVRILQESKPERITIGESSGFGIPPRLFFREAGYTELAARLGVPLLDLNEDRLVRAPLAKGVHHRDMLLAAHIRDADLKIWMPKLKYHIFASITNALKLNIGILTHRERMLYHDHRIHEKIVDLLEVGWPDVVISDAIDITYGFESAPYPLRLGALLAADHPLAADVVAAHILGYRPEDVRHLKIASERGYGSLELSDIELGGDVTIEELQAVPKEKRRLFQVLSELDTPIRFYAGVAGGTDVLCDGGCEAALKGCLGTIEKRRPGSLAKARRGAIVTGVYRGDVIEPDGPVLLVGSCTRVEGRLEAKRVARVRGCPMPAKALFIKAPLLFGMPSPMLDLRDALLFIAYSIGGWFRRLFRRLGTARAA
ncbi:MAG: DUF362 domain-containing protein [Myxococcales bacterium]|nr:MAG: DUF362 domain-containing protein [Myxococcales bacterium]